MAVRRPRRAAAAALGLNCGFGRREVATLRPEEVRLRERHPHADILHLDGTARGRWAMRLRMKMEVYGERRLWPVSVTAIE